MPARLAASALVAFLAAAPGACAGAPPDGSGTEAAPAPPGDTAPAPAEASAPRADAGSHDPAEAPPMTDPSVLLVAVAPGPIAIGGPRTLIALEAAAGAEGAAADLAAGRPTGGDPALLVHDLRADAPPGVLFDLYLVGPEAEPPSARDARLVGSINFYGANPVRSGFERFELADALAELRRRGEVSAARLPSLLVVPQGTVAPGSAPALGRVELIVDR